MEVNLQTNVRPLEAVAEQPGAVAPEKKTVGAQGAVVVTESGVAPVAGEEAIDERALSRTDALGQLVTKAYSDVGSEVAKNIGESAEKLKEFFERNQKAADEKADRLEALLDGEAARATSDAERFDAFVREAEMKV